MAEISVMDKLEKADELRQRGGISQQEFDAYKVKLLGSSEVADDSGSASPPPNVQPDEFVTFRGLARGWYRDPANHELARYWDGTNLSEERRRVVEDVEAPAPTPTPPPIGAPPVLGGVDRKRRGAPRALQDRSQTLTDTRPILRDSDQPVRVILEFRDAANVVVGPDDVPTWTEDSNDQVISLEVSGDGLSATITPRGIGSANVTVTTHDNDGTTVEVTEEVTVVAGEPTYGLLHWTAPESAPAHSSMSSP